MHSRPSLVRNIPFWILLVVSLVLTGIGAWLLLSRLATIESAITTPTAQSNVDVFVGQSAIVAAAGVLTAGLVGLVLSLTVAALAGLRAHEGGAAAETFDEDDTAIEAFPAPPAYAPAAPATPGHDDPVIAEDPDVETPSDATPPARA